MIQAKVNVVGRWGPRFAAHVNERVAVAVTEASVMGSKVAAQGASARSRTGHMAEMEVLETVGSPIGWAGGFRSKAFYALFQSKGTKNGIKGLHFLEHGRTAARAALIERLNRL